jgi:hypothetical protein
MDERRKGERQDALLKEYGEVSSNFRWLADIRFKLLAFVPIAAAATVALKNESTTAPWLGLSLFGLVVTLGIVTYNMRNDQLYNELVGRAATIERSLGLPDGGFAHRPQAWLAVSLPQKWWIPWRMWEVDHGTGIGTIYVASVALWLFGVFASVLEYARRAYVALKLPSGFIPDLFANTSIWVNLAAFGLTVLVTYLAVKAIKRQKKDRSKAMREAAIRAIDIGKRLELSDLERSDDFIQACKELSGEKAQTIKNRIEFYAELDRSTLDHYLLPSSNKKLSTSHLVALLTDLPAGWIFDCATNRKGKGPISSDRERT